MFLLFNLRSIHLYWWLCDNNYSDWTLDAHSLNLCWIIQAEMCIFFYFQIWISFSLSLYLLRTKEWVSHTVQWFPSPHSSEWKNPNYQIPSGQIMVTSIMKFIELTDWLTELNWTDLMATCCVTKEANKKIRFFHILKPVFHQLFCSMFFWCFFTVTSSSPMDVNNCHLYFVHSWMAFMYVTWWHLYQNHHSKWIFFSLYIKTP